MSSSFDVVADASDVFDGGEPLTLYRSTADNGIPIVAWRIDLSVTRSRVASSVTSVWGMPTPPGGPSPQPGDRLVDSAGEVAIVTRVEVKRADARQLVTTIRHVLDPEYVEYVDVETPVFDHGSGTTRWSTVTAAERGVVIASDPIDQLAESHTVFMLRRLDVTLGDRVYGHRSGYFRVLRPAGEATAGALCEVAVERFEPA